MLSEPSAKLSRRTCLRTAMTLPLAASLPSIASTQIDPWAQAQAIVDRLRGPLPFRAEDFVVTAYGAQPCAMTRVTALVSHTEHAEVDTPVAGAPDNHAAFAQAIEACHRAGGGRVLIPAGNWYCAGPIVLRSHVQVHLAAGARIFFSKQPADYARHGDVDCGPNGRLVRTRWQGNDCLNFASMVYAYGQDHIALTGEDWTSILDGQAGVPFYEGGPSWWTWKGHGRAVLPEGSGAQPNPANPSSLAGLAPWLSDAQRALIQGEGDRWRADEYFLPALSEAGVPLAKRVFGLGHYLRPSMIHLIGCTNVLLQGYQVRHTPFWQHHPVHCRNLVIRGVHANSLGPNSDGFDPEACDHVLVEHCTFDTGDDCIAIKAGKNLDTQWGPSQNIVIQHCTMQSGHGAVTLGSEMAGGIQNVFAQHLLMQNIHWQTNPLNTAIRLKTNMNRGGYLRNLHVRHVQLPNGVQTTPAHYKPLPGTPDQARKVSSSGGAVITIDCDYTPTADNVRSRSPVVSHISISQVTVGNVAMPGGQHSCYQAIVVQGPVAANYNGPVPAPPVWPVRDVQVSDCDFGQPRLADNPIHLYNVQGLALQNVKIGGVTLNRTVSAPA